MRKVLIVLILIAVVGMLTACSITTKEGRLFNAKIRYFDGSAEMIQLKGFTPCDGYVCLKTVYGDEIRIGWNNVIIIEEDEEHEQQ